MIKILPLFILPLSLAE